MTKQLSMKESKRAKKSKGTSLDGHISQVIVTKDNLETAGQIVSKCGRWSKVKVKK